MKTESRVRDHELGVTAVDSVARKTRAIAKILAIGPTIHAFAIGPAEPRNPDAIAD
jgi:hypothetical protein